MIVSDEEEPEPSMDTYDQLASEENDPEELRSAELADLTDLDFDDGEAPVEKSGKER